MKYDVNCIFCKIVNGDIPCAKLYEDDDVMAFLDVNPVTYGHALVISKDHYVNLSLFLYHWDPMIL